MSLIRSILLIVSMSVLSPNTLAGVFKCTDESGNTTYQSASCADKNRAAKLNITTGGSVDLTVEKKKKSEQELLKQQQEAELQKQRDIELTRIAKTKEQNALNKLLVQNNPIQFSAFAIPPYVPEYLSETLKSFESRLPEIEKFRRLAAQKALATGECRRVESDELNALKSTLKSLVFSIGCSSAKTFHFNETELSNND